MTLHNHPVPATAIADAAWHMAGDLEALDVELQTMTISPADLRGEYTKRLARRFRDMLLPAPLATAAAQAAVDEIIADYGDGDEH